MPDKKNYSYLAEQPYPPALPASETQMGVAELATNAEALTADDARFLTPRTHVSAHALPDRFVFAYANTTTTISGGVDTKVVLDAVWRNPDGSFDIVGSLGTASHWTPQLAGYYLVLATVSVVAGGTSTNPFYRRLTVNEYTSGGTLVGAKCRLDQQYIRAGQDGVMTGSFVGYFAASGNYFQVQLYNDATNTLTAQAGINSTYFQAVFLHP